MVNFTCHMTGLLVESKHYFWVCLRKYFSMRLVFESPSQCGGTSQFHRCLNRKKSRKERVWPLPAGLLNLGHWSSAIHTTGSSCSKAVGLGLDLLQLPRSSSFQRQVLGLSADIIGVS